jgi:molybdate-binding protein
VQFAAEMQGLTFITAIQEPYDLCFHREQEDSPEIQALIEAVRSRAYRKALKELPGYSTEHTGELVYT